MTETHGERATGSASAGPLIHDGKVHGQRPADGEPLDPVPCTPASEIAGIVASVRKAAAVHAARDVETRASMLRRFKDEVLARADAIVRTLAAEVGKPEVESYLHEVIPTADLAHFWSTEGPQFLAAHEPALDAVSYPGKRGVIERVPRGVIGLITPWNFPVAIPLRTIFPALLAGDGVVLKPSELTPRCALLIAEAAKAVFGPDLVRVVVGGGDVGAALIASGVDAVVFTGSVGTGRKVAHAAADALIPVSLELGGKDAAIVLADADVERAAHGILWGAMANAGQNCASVERVYAVKPIAAPLRKRLAELAKELVPGRDIGPLASDAQLAIVERHVGAAAKEGGEVLAGGERLDRPGLWFAPTVLSEVPETCEAISDETFGPIVPVVEVKDEDAAIELANGGRYGLSASVWTRDLERGERVARRLRSGVVVINNHGFTPAIPSLPWTGVAESGYGVTNSPHALDILTRPRAIVIDARRAKKEMWWYPYTPGLLQVGRAMTALRGRGGPIAKLKALFALIGGFAKRWRV